MDINDFRYMRQGQQLNDLRTQDAQCLKPLNQCSNKKEKALFLLHGFSSSPAVYRYLAPQIKHYDAIICPVLPGHAESIHTFSRIKAADWFNAARTLCASLVKEYQKVDVLGLSLGGLIACELSQIFPLNHLYLLAPALKLQMNTKIMLHITRLFNALGFIHLRNAAGDLLNQEHAEISYRKLPLPTIIEMLQLVQHYQWNAPKCPTDLFLGTQDHVVNSKAVEQLFLPLENTRIHWLDNSAHVLPLDNDLHDIIQCINKNRS
jgi:carboxylesterase